MWACDGLGLETACLTCVQLEMDTIILVAHSKLGILSDTGRYFEHIPLPLIIHGRNRTWK
jgi:hypothetical protein